MSALFYTHIDDSPVGPLLLAGDSEALHVLAFGVGSRPREIDADWKLDTKGVLKDVRKELDQYFAGKLKTFSTKLAFNGTPFQNQVWKELTRIPYGETISYLDLANRIDNPKAVRAVGHGERRQPDRHHRALSPRDRFKRIAHRIRRRATDQAGATRTRKRPADAALITRRATKARRTRSFLAKYQCCYSRTGRLKSVLRDLRVLRGQRL